MTALTADVAGTDEALTGAFMTAFLLTGSAEGAEAAVLEGLTAMDGNSMPDETLLLGTVAAAIATKIAGNRSINLPIELRRVLRLRKDLRQAFVLRVLIGLSREMCARVLNTPVNQIDELTGIAARMLTESAVTAPQREAVAASSPSKREGNALLWRRSCKPH